MHRRWAAGPQEDELPRGGGSEAAPGITGWKGTCLAFTQARTFLLKPSSCPVEEVVHDCLELDMERNETHLAALVLLQHLGIAGARCWEQPQSQSRGETRSRSRLPGNTPAGTEQPRERLVQMGQRMDKDEALTS